MWLKNLHKSAERLVKDQKKVDKFQKLRLRVHKSILVEKSYKYKKAQKIPKVKAVETNKEILDRAERAREYFNKQKLDKINRNKKKKNKLD